MAPCGLRKSCEATEKNRSGTSEKATDQGAPLGAPSANAGLNVGLAVTNRPGVEVGTGAPRLRVGSFGTTGSPCETVGVYGCGPGF